MIKNYTSLFDNTDEMLNSKQIIEVLKNIQEKQPEIYCGKGKFKRLIIEFEKGISEKELSSVLKNTRDLFFRRNIQICSNLAME